MRNSRDSTAHGLMAGLRSARRGCLGLPMPSGCRVNTLIGRFATSRLLFQQWIAHLTKGEL
jgi:hypothetical protein